MNKKIIILIGLYIFFISVNVNAYTIELPNNYILNYEKISNTDNCLIDCSLKFKIKLNKNYLITDNSFITKKFKNYFGGLDLIDSGFRIQSIEEYQYKDKNKPIYGEVEKQKFCSGIQNINYGIINSNNGWCNDSLCLLNSSDCYYEHKYNSYEIIENGLWFYYTVNEIIDYEYSTGNKEVWNNFNPIGKTITANQWYSIELWGKRLPSIEKKSIFINISLMGSFLQGLSWWNSSYQYKRLINCSKLNNEIPIIINGSDGFSISGEKQYVWSYCSGLGTAIYYNNYTDYVIANDTNRLPMEVEKGNGTNYNPSNVWDSNYLMVHHLQESGTGTRFDSTTQVDGTTSGYDGDEATDSGKINGADDLEGTNDYISTTTDFPTTDFTYEAWVKPDAVDNRVIIGENAALAVLSSGDYGGHCSNSGKFTFHTYDGGYLCSKGTTVISLGTWYYVVGVYDGTNNKIYVNGMEEDTDIYNAPSSQSNMRIGCVVTGTYPFDGIIDEVRVSDNTRSSSQINQTYQNILNTVGFGNLESTESFNNPPIIINSYPPDNSTNISLYPILNVTVYDNDNDIMNVTFYNASDNNAICINNSISNGTIVYCKWSTISQHNTTYNWYVNATDNYTTTKSSTYNFTTQENITTTTISTEGLINIRVIDLTDSQYDEILIYQNDNTSTKYIMMKNLSKSFKICQNVSYSFIIVPKTVSIIRNMDQYFLDYLFGNIYLLVFILSLISIGGYLIFRQK